ncbi:26S proteasome regulatory subunit RPN2 [Intoshia linei]|uniref:26S proteasome non-ATPase regulatory subunit 1 n=1 Tax=Intoshia linei TaxID=1819745 RepID=A0A177B2R0_9BILA|nr:26S proteasome regulatory subunit RPN2 [Intoshia linei]
MKITSAGGLISLLQEENNYLKDYGIKCLSNIADSFWPEISESLNVIEDLVKDKDFENRHGASFLASKIYYNLGMFEKSLEYALEAKDLFNISEKSEYTITIISKCIDAYKSKRTELYPDKKEETANDIRIERLIDSLFERCFALCQYNEAVGMALELRRPDMLQKTIVTSKDKTQLCMYIYALITQNYTYIKIRSEIYDIILEYLDTTNAKDAILKTYCNLIMKYETKISDMLMVYTKNQSLNRLGLQVCFEIRQNGFRSDSQNIFDLYEEQCCKEFGDEEVWLKDERGKFFEKVRSILEGDKYEKLRLMFTVQHNQRDPQIVAVFRDGIRNQIAHVATVIANGYMNCATTCDTFIRNNTDWLLRAQKWAKFTAVASIGVIHKGHEDGAMQILKKYLPDPTKTTDTFCSGGALFALGLIHRSNSEKIQKYLFDVVRRTSNAEVRHGAALGLGLVEMGSCCSDTTESLKMYLYNDDAIGGEACAMAIGMINVGCGRNSNVREMISYASDTQHDKIIRGIALAIPFFMVDVGAECESDVEFLLTCPKPELRWSACLTLAAAYFGSESSEIANRLMDVAVTDVDDDVRRLATASIGFIYYGNLKFTTNLVSNLSDCYNSHVRAGVAMAIGISAAGVIAKEPLSIVERLSNDSAPYVRQSALIAMSMMMIQHNESTCPKLNTFRDHLMKVIRDSHEEPIVKFGAIMAYGILDAGGRNMNIALRTPMNTVDKSAVVGMLSFLQYWYWFPLGHMLSLCFTPTYVHVLNDDLLTPNIKFNVNVRPSLMAYPMPIKIKQSHPRERVDVPILSALIRQKKRDRTVTTRYVKNVPVSHKSSKTNKAKIEKQPSFTEVTNPGRILRQYLPQVRMVTTRFMPIKSLKCGGIIMMEDVQPETPLDININKMDSLNLEKEEAEAAPPTEFEWTENTKTD